MWIPNKYAYRWAFVQLTSLTDVQLFDRIYGRRCFFSPFFFHAMHSVCSAACSLLTDIFFEANCFLKNILQYNRCLFLWLFVCYWATFFSIPFRFIRLLINGILSWFARGLADFMNISMKWQIKENRSGPFYTFNCTLTRNKNIYTFTHL